MGAEREGEQGGGGGLERFGGGRELRRDTGRGDGGRHCRRAGSGGELSAEQPGRRRLLCLPA
jgi:hypothetical protein